MRSVYIEEADRSTFTPGEIAHLQGQRLGRIATVGADGQPHVVPVTFRYNPVRGIEIRGVAEVLATGGESLGPGFDPEMFRVRPRRIVSWGLDGNSFQQNARSVP